MATLDGPTDDGLIPPDPDALLEQRRADPDAVLEQRIAAAKEAAANPDEAEPVLAPVEEDEVVDLIHAGRKEKRFELFGRKIHLRTLTIEEELKVSEITKRYLGSDGYLRAYRTAVVAAAIRTIDGELLFNPISDTELDQLIVKKFEKLLEYYPLAVDQIFSRYQDMERELLALVEKLGKSQG